MTAQILFILTLIGFIIYIFRFRTAVTDRLVYLLGAVTGIILVFQPDITMKVAHLIGIGRGTDLTLYVFILLSLFFTYGITSETKQMKHQLTLLARELAIRTPQIGPLKTLEKTNTRENMDP